MTNEEAIEYLKLADTTVGKKIKTKIAEAIEMAICALKNEQMPNAEKTAECEHDYECDKCNDYACEKTDTTEWKEDNGDYFCSNCGYKYSALDEDGCPIPDKYCPNCGAKMKGDTE